MTNPPPSSQLARLSQRSISPMAWLQSGLRRWFGAESANAEKSLQRRLGLIGGWTGLLLLVWMTDLPWFRETFPLRRLELEILASFTRLRTNYLQPSIRPPDEIVILAIDDKSLNIANELFPEDLEANPLLGLMQSWPWPRQVHAAATQILLEAGAKAVIFDVIFSTPSSFGPEDDLAFQTILDQAGSQVVLAGQYPTQITEQGQISYLTLPAPDLIGFETAVGFANSLPDPYTGQVFLLPTYDQLLASRRANFPGFEDLPALPSLAEAGLDAAGESYTDPQVLGPYLWLYYYPQTGGRRGFRTVSYSELMIPELRDANLAGGAFFQNKIVWIGATAPIFQDYHHTPLGDMAGVEIHATAMATLLEQRGLRPVPLLLVIPVLLVLGVGGGWLITAPSKISHVVNVTLSGIAGWSLIGFGTFVSGWIVPVTFTGSLMLGLIGVSEATRRAVIDQVEKLRLRRTLDRYVSAPVAQEIMSQREDFENLLKGRKRQVTVLFSDVRGFTTLSSELPPELLVPQLNYYLTAMVSAITEEQGCIDKFVGDAVMAEFGSPISAGAKQDALNAVKAALGMRAALAQLRDQWAQEGLPLFFNGIGINAGEAIAGNVGSIQRLEYTVIGDTVNVASRVESLTKEFATDILITQAVYDLIAAEIDAILIGTRQLRGRGTETALYQVIGLKGSGRELFDQVHQDYLVRLSKGTTGKTEDQPKSPQKIKPPAAALPQKR